MSDTLHQPLFERAAWLRKLYFIRAAFSFVWVALAFTVAKGSPAVATACWSSTPHGTPWRTCWTPG
jgi:hypothetical protein